MAMDYAQIPGFVIEDIVRLRRCIDHAEFPPRRTDDNLIVGSWNIRNFGAFHHAWTENSGSPKRNLRGLVLIAEIIQCFDVIALQEVKRNTAALRFLMQDLLGPQWAVILTDVTAGSKGNTERLAYLYDTRRVTPSGLAGQIVLPPAPDGDPVEQFDRTPYMAGFRAGGERFTLLTVHIRYGSSPPDRLPELQRFAQYTAGEIRDRVRSGSSSEEPNLIVLGDFNIDRRQGNPLFDAFVETGLWVPEALREVSTTYGTEAKHYDQIAWFRDDFELKPTGRAGKVDFAGRVFQELTRFQMSFRVSDHFPLWIEFSTDRTVEQMAQALGVDPDHPEPLRDVPD
jgi:endonuclease/exonuclease/phosphatase family metal-dependent hydrolase